MLLYIVQAGDVPLLGEGSSEGGARQNQVRKVCENSNKIKTPHGFDCWVGIV